MKMLTTVVAAMCLTACASKPSFVNEAYVKEPNPERVYALINYKGPEAMTSQEVVQQARQCIINKLKPHVHYLSVKTDQGKTLVPVNVICEAF
jgi:hypothetical protein